MNSHDSILTEIDRKVLVARLREYYGTHCMDQLALMVKRDLKDVNKMRSLIEAMGFDDEEFFYHMGGLFFEVFNKMTIKKIKKNLGMNEEKK